MFSQGRVTSIAQRWLNYISEVAGEPSESLLSHTHCMLCHLPVPWSAIWVSASGCVCSVVLTDLALSLVSVSEGLWETGSQASTVDRKRTADHTYTRRARRTAPGLSTLWLPWAILGLDSTTQPLLVTWMCSLFEQRQTKDIQVKIYNIFVV